MDYEIEVEGRNITITNCDKYMWPNEVKKIDYVKYIDEMAEYMLPYMKDRLLTTIRYPNGVDGKSFYQKNKPSHAPEWIESTMWNGTNYILANNKATLIWLANLASLEMHVTFHHWKTEDVPTELVFDLDPTDPDRFKHVVEMAIRLHEVLTEIGLQSIAKTSGATGLQVYIPIKQQYTFDQTRKVAKFIAEYMEEKYPQDITTERLIKNRGNKLYIDYLQHGKGKTLPAPYSLRARKVPTVSTPITWAEANEELSPSDFTIFSVPNRIRKVGNLFLFKKQHSLDDVLKFVKNKK